MLSMNIEWDGQQPKQQRPTPQRSDSKGILGGLFTTSPRKDDGRQTGYHSSSRPAPRRAETVSVLPPGVKMPTGNQPELCYGADGAKYLVIPPRRSNSSSRPRQIIVTSSHASPSPRRMDSSGSSRNETRSPPHRSNSSSRPMSPPSAHRAPKIVGDPELVKQYEHSQRSVARWVESVGDTGSQRSSSSSKRTTTR